jgi:hypothetical protein
MFADWQKVTSITRHDDLYCGLLGACEDDVIVWVTGDGRGRNRRPSDWRASEIQQKGADLADAVDLEAKPHRQHPLQLVENWLCEDHLYAPVDGCLDHPT